MILILTKAFDPHADMVVQELNNHRADCVRLDLASLPTDASATLGFSGHSFRGYIDVPGRRIELEEITAVWNRRPGKPAAGAHLSGEAQQFARRESEHFVSSLWPLLRNCLWINKFDAAAAASLKPYQLEIARSVGLAIPRTLMTNNPGVVLDFYSECNGNIIYKPFTPFYRDNMNGTYSGIYTNRLTLEQISSRLDKIAEAPCIFQEYVPKSIELRVTMIADRVFAASIDSQASERSKDDWRRYDFDNVAYAPFELPGAITELLRAFMRRMDLVFGCIDMVLTPDGKYVFLEVNQAGQWAWIESFTGLAIKQSLCEMLMQGVPESSLREAASA